jgi:peptidoglycan/LPS O-acetylase OafA/YrhL
MKSHTEKAYFNALTGVRAIAAYMVFLHHFNPLTFMKGSFLYDFVQEFHIGVTIFFVLSGFLIAHRYYDSVTFSFKKYLINRVARIYPMYVLLTAGTFIWYAFVNGYFGIYDLKILLLNLSFLRGFFDEFKFTGIAQGWSLTVEETFYFLAPVLFILIRKRKIFLILLPLILLAIGYLITSLIAPLDFHGLMGSNEFYLLYTFFGRSTEFILGISLAIFLKKIGEINPVKRLPFTYTGLLGTILCIAWIASLKGNYDFGIRPPLGKTINTFILPLFGILPLFYGLLTEQTWVSKILSSRLFVLLGKASYIFYLIHLGMIEHWVSSTFDHMLITFIFLNIVSIILFRLVEEPLNLGIRKYFRSAA